MCAPRVLSALHVLTRDRSVGRATRVRPAAEPALDPVADLLSPPPSFRAHPRDPPVTCIVTCHAMFCLDRQARGRELPGSLKKILTNDQGEAAMTAPAAPARDPAAPTPRATTAGFPPLIASGFRRTKIVCTVGPASMEPGILEAMVRTGMDVARINMSHGDRAGHEAAIHRVREAAAAEGRPVGILVDLQGPKIRVGRLPEPRTLVVGDEITFVPEGHETGDQLPTTYSDLVKDVRAGDQVLLDDGLLELVCTGADGDRARFRVVRGGVLTSNKGINLPNGEISAASLTAKDRHDLAFALDAGVDFIGLSFVRRASDVEELKALVQGRAQVVAKIEMARALREINSILEASDMVMVARGDLGVELPFERVPLAQKRIIEQANLLARPVITATQMLESMLEHPRPTRAEASDVANAVLDGTDAVMLSGETAVGRYPVKAVEALVRIIREIEAAGVLDRGPRYLGGRPRGRRGGASPREHAVAASTVKSAAELRCPGILVITRSGFSAKLVSSHRPAAPILAVTTDPATVGSLSVVWGVQVALAEGIEISYDALSNFGRKQMLARGMATPGDTLVITAGFPFHQSGTTNTMRVETL